LILEFSRLQIELIAAETLFFELQNRSSKLLYSN
jgi:hypothetical protein